MFKKTSPVDRPKRISRQRFIRVSSTNDNSQGFDCFLHLIEKKPEAVVAAKAGELDKICRQHSTAQHRFSSVSCFICRFSSF